MSSYRIPISSAVTEPLGLNPSASLNDFRVTHQITDDGLGGVVVLSDVYDFSRRPTVKGCFVTHADAAGAVRQRPLTSLSRLLKEHDISPMSIQTFGPRCVIGAYAGASVVKVRCGLFFGDWTQDSFRFVPNCGSRIRVFSPGIVYGTLHHNHEGRHYPARFDDAVCRYEKFNPAAVDLPSLGPVRLVAHLRPTHDVDFPGLSPAPPGSPFANQPGYGVYTDGIEPLPDGRVVVSIWNTAQNSLEDYYFVILTPDGRIDATIRATEKRAPIAFSRKLGLLVAIGLASSQLIDLAGNIVENVAHPPRTKSLFRRFPFVGIGPTAGVRFLASELVDDQTHTALVIPEPDVADGAEYLAALHRALVDHDKWVKAEVKARNPTFFRWTE
jgi:hypothetical protein